MKRIACGIWMLLFSSYSLLAGTTGKIAGHVIDARTKEPLVGANIILEGTSLGGSTDIDGDYYIINVPVGEYTIIVSYVGYRTIKHPGVKVILDQTTPVNFELTEDITEGEEIVVTAEAFKVQKDETAKKVTINAEDIQTMPVQDFSDLIASQAGVIKIESSVQQIPGFEDRGIEEIHVRGGRYGEIGYTIDGMFITNPFYGGRYTYTELNPFAARQIDIKTGVFDAEYGGAMSQMVNIVTRDGGDKLEGNIRVQVSNLGRFGNPATFFSPESSPPVNIALEPDEKLDYREINGGIGGPIPFTGNRVKFIVTGHKRRSAFRAYEFDNMTYDRNQPQDSEHNFHLNKLDTIPGWRGMGFINGWDVYSKLSFNISNSMKFAASFWNLQTTFRTANLANSYYQYHEEGRNIVTQSSDRQAVMFNHQLSPKVFYDIRVSRFYQEVFNGVTDNGKEDGRYLSPDEYEEPRGDPDSEDNPYYFEYAISGHDRYYHRSYAETYEGFFNILGQATKHHQIKAGASYRRHNLMINEIQLPWLISPYIERYTKHPEEAGFYIQDLIEYDYMTIRLGLRMDMFNAHSKTWADPYAKADEKVLVDSRWEYAISPRLGFSHVITDNATFTFGYGKFIQRPTYRNIYINDIKDVTTPSPIVGNAGLTNEQMTAYEFGLNVGISDEVIVQLLGWSKEYSGLTSTERIPQFPYSYTTFLNTDYATSRGVDLILRYQRPTSSLVLQYTLSRATANRRDPWEGYRSTHTPRTMPKREILMSYDRTHDLSLFYNLHVPEGRGLNVFGLNLFQKTTLNIIFKAMSGWPYTPVVGNVAGETNSERGPWYTIINLNFRKYFNIAATRLIFGVVVQNLFDWKNPIDIWPTTGKPDDPGPRLNQLIEQGFYSKTLFDRPYMYGTRRSVRFTIEFAF